MTGYLIRDVAPVAAISREPERPRDAQDAINGITDIAIVPILPIERPPHQPAKGVRISNLAVSALASLIPVDRRLDGGFRLKTGRRVFGLGVVIAPIAQFVGIALEMRVHVARHQFIAPLRRGPVRTVVRNGGRNRLASRCRRGLRISNTRSGPT